MNAVAYPNPTNGMITLEAQGMNHISVCNIMGQSVMEMDVDADQMQLNLDAFGSGMYLIRINTVNGQAVKRVSVVR